MKALLLSRYFPPEIGTAAHLFHELARGLARRGHAVTVVTGFPWYNMDDRPARYRGRLKMTEAMDGFRVVRVSAPLFGPRPWRLALGQLTSPAAAFLGALAAGRPDFVLAYSPPLAMGAAAAAAAALKRAPMILGVQDLHPQVYIDQGVLRNKAAITLLRLLERWCYARADLVTVHSEGNRRPIVGRGGAAAGKVKVLPNWIDTDEMRPLPRNNAFSARHGLDGVFVAGYAGTLGMSQGVEVVIEAARLLGHREDILFFIVGDGIARAEAEARAFRLGLRNVRFLGMQPKRDYPLVVASFDAGLVTLNPQVRTPVIPSKILSFMAGGRPVLAALPLDGDAPAVIAEAGCGFSVEAGDAAGLAERIVHLADRPALRAEMGRRGRDFVEREFSIAGAVLRLEALLAGLKTGL